MKKINKIITIITPYCDRIVHSGGHYKAYPKGVKSIIVISASSSDINNNRQVYRDFRRVGHIIKELLSCG